MSASHGGEGPIGLRDLLGGEPAERIEVDSGLWGFGGLHGGLALSLMSRSASRLAPGLELRGITGHFHRVLRGAMTVESRIIRSGRTTSSVMTTASSPDGVCVTSTATFGAPQPAARLISPTIPAVAGPLEIDEQLELPGKPPVMQAVEVRPLETLQPYVGADHAVMTAWVRIRASAESATPHAVLFFLDALPPSYTTVLREERHVPTLELSAHVTPRDAVSPWVLVRARTEIARDGGWVTEVADAWDESGRHLGRAQQLRLTLALR